MVLEHHQDMLQYYGYGRQSAGRLPAGVTLARRRHSEALEGSSPMRRFVIVLLVVFVLPILVGGVVLLVAGRRVAVRALQCKMWRRFPEVSWMTTEQLAL